MIADGFGAIASAAAWRRPACDAAGLCRHRLDFLPSQPRHWLANFLKPECACNSPQVPLFTGAAKRSCPRPVEPAGNAEQEADRRTGRYIGRSGSPGLLPFGSKTTAVSMCSAASLRLIFTFSRPARPGGGCPPISSQMKQGCKRQKLCRRNVTFRYRHPCGTGGSLNRFTGPTDRENSRFTS